MTRCSKCGIFHLRIGQRYCLKCHAMYLRGWRKLNPLTKKQRIKANARSYAKVYKKRGKLIKQSCEICGSNFSEMHHDDYDSPLDVKWLCRKHHLELHARET